MNVKGYCSYEIIPNETPYDSTLKLLESLGADTSILQKKKEQYILQYKLGNKQFLQDYEKYFDSSYEEEQDRVVNLYYNMLINEEDSIEEIR